MIEHANKPVVFVTEVGLRQGKLSQIEVNIDSVA